MGEPFPNFFSDPRSPKLILGSEERNRVVASCIPTAIKGVVEFVINHVVAK
jgi:hypothetical protein